MNTQTSYQQKLVSVEDAAKVIRSGDRVGYSPISSAPVDVINAICRRKDELENVSLYTALALYLFDYFGADYRGRISHTTLFMGPFERMMMGQGNIEVISCQFAHAEWILRNVVMPRVFIAEVSPPDEHGNMSYGIGGTAIGHTTAEMAKTVIVQINRQNPYYVYGPREAFINVADVDYICERDHPVFEVPQIPVSDIEKTIAGHITPYIEDGSTIQIGIGGLANAIGFSLEHHKDLGVHTEMLTDSMVVLAEKGVITGRHKTLYPGEMTCSFGIGSRKLYEFMDRNAMLKNYPVAYITSESVIAQNHKMVTINNAIMCDLTGQICAESVGFHQYSCTGGQLNFVRGARLSPGGKSFLAIESTAKKGDQMISRILSALPPGAVITTPRSDVEYVVTEYGVANLRGKSIPARVKEMLRIAHPLFREQLLQEAKSSGLL